MLMCIRTYVCKSATNQCRWCITTVPCCLLYNYIYAHTYVIGCVINDVHKYNEFICRYVHLTCFSLPSFPPLLPSPPSLPSFPPSPLSLCSFLLPAHSHIPSDDHSRVRLSGPNDYINASYISVSGSVRVLYVCAYAGVHMHVRVCVCVCVCVCVSLAALQGHDKKKKQYIACQGQLSCALCHCTVMRRRC